MEDKDLDKLRALLSAASLIIRSQDINLITAEERTAYLATLNEKIHTEIEALIA